MTDPVKIEEKPKADEPPAEHRSPDALPSSVVPPPVAAVALARPSQPPPPARPSQPPPAASPSQPPNQSEPLYYGRRKKRTHETCQILIRNGDVTVQNVRKALKIQEERGGQIGRILVAMGACTERMLSRALIEQLQMRGNPEGNLSLAARANPHIAGLRVACSPVLTTLVMALADTVALACAVLCGLGTLYAKDYAPRVESITLLIAATVLSGATFPATGLYAAAADGAPDELRNSTRALTLSLLGVAAVAIFGDRATRHWTLLTLCVWWATGAVFVPFSRALARHWFARKPWYGHPVVVLGAAKTGRLIVRALQAQPERGLKPVFMLDDDLRKQGTLRASITNDMLHVQSMSVSSHGLLSESTMRAAQDLMSGLDARADEGIPPSEPPGSRARGMFAEVEGVPVVGDLSLAPVLSQRLKIRYAVLAMPGVDSNRLLRLTERVGGFFTHILIIPDLFGFGSLGVPAKEVGGVLGIEVRQQLLLRGPQLAKRALDLVLTILGGIAISPVIFTIATLIAFDSKGPVLYWQKRLGRDGRQFMAAKFRTMHGDGEARLRALLDADPALKAEYEEFHKLNRDPRVTRVGRVLRKYSLDELPQLWNVFRGQMSLVGPRPYLEREVQDMEGQEAVILRAMPGMTGMWQVTDRNTTGFPERLKMDVYYVRNWSPWLDVYLLARTILVVVKGTGV